MKSSLFPPLPSVERSISRFWRISRFVLPVLLLSGCTVLSYKSPSGEHFTRSSLGSKTSIAHLTFEANTNGVRKLQLRGYQNDSSQSLGVVTDAAVRAAVSAAKP